MTACSTEKHHKTPGFLCWIRLGGPQAASKSRLVRLRQACGAAKEEPAFRPVRQNVEETEQPAPQSHAVLDSACEKVTQTDVESMSSRRFSKSDGSPTARTTTQKFSGSSSRLSELRLNTKHPLFLVDEAIGVREDQKKAEAKETGDVVSKRKGRVGPKAVHGQLH